jgi:hypothetical protein
VATIQCAEPVCHDLIWGVGLATDDRDYISWRGTSTSNRSRWLRDEWWTVTRRLSTAAHSSARRRHHFRSPCASMAYTETAQRRAARSSDLGRRQAPLAKLRSRLHFLRRWRWHGKLSPVLVGHGAWRSGAINVEVRQLGFGLCGTNSKGTSNYLWGLLHWIIAKKKF